MYGSVLSQAPTLPFSHPEGHLSEEKASLASIFWYPPWNKGHVRDSCQTYSAHQCLSQNTGLTYQ